MSSKRWRRASLGVGVAAGVFADGSLRFFSGEEGNLLVHTVVFLGSALIAAGAVYGLFLVWNLLFQRKKR